MVMTRSLRFARSRAALGRAFVRCFAPSVTNTRVSFSDTGCGDEVPVFHEMAPGGVDSAFTPYSPRRPSRRGGVKLGCFAFMILVGLGGWAGAYVGDAYWKYYQYADAFKQEAKFAGHYTDRQIKQHLRSMADSLVLPDDAYEIVVERGRHHIVIDNQYYAHVNMGIMSRDFFFNPHAEADF